MPFQTNSDGLVVHYSTRSPEEDQTWARMIPTTGPEKCIYVEWTAAQITAGSWYFDADASNPGTTPDSFSDKIAYIPAYSYITKAHLNVLTAATGSAGTTNIGLYTKAGGTFDVDGIDATIALTAVDALTEAVACDGDKVGGALNTGAANHYIGATIGSGTITAGKFGLWVFFVPPY